MAEEADNLEKKEVLVKGFVYSKDKSAIFVYVEVDKDASPHAYKYDRHLQKIFHPASYYTATFRNGQLLIGGEHAPQFLGRVRDQELSNKIHMELHVARKLEATAKASKKLNSDAIFKMTVGQLQAMYWKTNAEGKIGLEILILDAIRNKL